MQSWRDAMGYGAASVAGAAVGPAAASTGLGALGFSSVGPVAGSYAAAYMSAAGAIKAGEPPATLHLSICIRNVQIC